MVCSSAAAFLKCICPQFRCHIYSDFKFQPHPQRIRGTAMSNTGYWYCRIIEWFGLEGTLHIISFQPPCHGQGPLPPDQFAQSPIQPGLEHCQGGGSHSFSGQPMPGPHHPHGEEFLPCIWSKSAPFQFKATGPCPTTPCPCQKPLSILPVGPFRYWRLL